MESVVNPGPIDCTLLLSQHKHKSKLLWKCEISFRSLMRTLWLSVGGQRLIASTYLFGEITITLQNVQDVARRIRPWRTLLKTLTRCAIEPTDNGVSRVRIHSITGYLRDQLQVDPIGDATPVERGLSSQYFSPLSGLNCPE
ncbi:hypothetical protein KY290_005486 [Solanum tuberosum]|uniref:DUF5641 domain-containing protein n=1 Tax=Solanum tuberosum TaxID=4113 RepID=A0ABQ7WEA6_SOLTU|nr:hypothetical protein KY289_005876 [Solanum tuberosum]KAH0779059.1 hypothetical protein KY290_005486 [Solanum tuberosum]